MAQQGPAGRGNGTARRLSAQQWRRFATQRGAWQWHGTAPRHTAMALLRVAGHGNGTVWLRSASQWQGTASRGTAWQWQGAAALCMAMAKNP